jgi:hypothetical protein
MMIVYYAIVTVFSALLPRPQCGAVTLLACATINIAMGCHYDGRVVAKQF